MYLMPSATDMSSLTTLLSGSTSRKPVVGFGVVGTKMLMMLSPSSVFTCSAVTKPTEYSPLRGNSTMITCWKLDFFSDVNAWLTCLTVP